MPDHSPGNTIILRQNLTKQNLPKGIFQCRLIHTVSSSPTEHNVPAQLYPRKSLIIEITDILDSL